MKDVFIRVNGVGVFIFEDGEVIMPDGDSLKWFKSKPQKGKNTGYIYSRIDGKTVYQHRLLAKAFIPNPKNKPIVNHIDGDGCNNSLDNIEWSTYSENNQHAHDTGLNGRKKEIMVTHLLTGNKYYFKSLKQALSYTKQFRSTACRILNGSQQNPKVYRYTYL